MKRHLILLFTFLSLTVLQDCNAQTWEEWFRQRKTQKKYLIQQIAALKLHLDNMKKGVDIVYKGWNTIQNISDGHFSLHRDFFSSLKNVNPHITNTARIADIIAFQWYITQDLKALTEFCKASEEFTADEVYYITKVYLNMLLLCEANLTELLSVIRTDEAEMTDDERLVRINKVYEEMKDKRAFAKAFNNEARMLAAQRLHERRSIEQTRIATNPFES